VNTKTTSKPITHFLVQRKVTIPSDNIPHKVTFTTLSLKSDFSYFSTPKLDSNAYVKIKAVNNTDVPLLSGFMNIFFDNNFITTGEMKDISPKEEFENFLGVDPKVRVEYKPVQKKKEVSSTLVFGTRANKLTIKRKAVIKNGKKSAIKMTVSDSFPKTTDSKIQVSLVEPEIVNQNIKEVKLSDQTVAKVQCKLPQQVIDWVFTLAEQGEVEIPLTYAISWPEGISLENENL